MPRPNLQTVIVRKDVARTRKAATEVARKYANRIYTSRETKNTWRFRQRPPADFVKGTFRTFKVPGVEGVSLVYGDLKSIRSKVAKKKAAKKKTKKKVAKKNPDVPPRARGRATFYWKQMVDVLIPGATSLDELAGLAHEGRLHFSQSPVYSGTIEKAILERAGQLDPSWRSKVHEATPPSERIDHLLRSYGREGTVARLPDLDPKDLWLSPEERRSLYQAREGQMALRRQEEENPGSFAGFLRQQEKLETNPKRRPLKNPKKMPDPGAMAWLGSLLEWRWKGGRKDVLWEPQGAPWMFLWSPMLKAVVCVPDPGTMRRMPKVSRKDGGAKLFERFTARNAKNTYEISIPKSKLQKLGSAGHIVYRSDKWNPGRDIDYIHDFGKGVELYCGPSLKNPKVFLCFGGKLTATERGLVF